jgi:hypothetical protein
VRLDVKLHIFLIAVLYERGSRDCVVGIATGYGLDDRGFGVRVPVRSKIFSSPRYSYQFWGLPSLLSNGYRGPLSPGVERPGREADHSPPTLDNGEVRQIFTPAGIRTPAIHFVARHYTV